jgi:hypothetical protein
MGGWLPWDLLAPETELLGTVIADATNYSDDDGDWCLGVQPDSGYQDLLMVPGQGASPDTCNARGVVECEVFPPGQLHSSEMFGFASLVGQRVKVIGPWVNDTGHGQKAEIHPAHLVRSLDPVPEPQGDGVSYQILVFSECSDSLGPPTPPDDYPFPKRGRLFLPPTAGQSYTYDEDLPLPLPSSAGLSPYARFVDPGSGWYRIREVTLSADNTLAHVHVETGTEAENHGYASFRLVLGWEPAATCQPLFDQISGLLGDLASDQADWDAFPSPTAEERKLLGLDMARIRKQIASLRATASASGCGPYPN